MPLQAYNLIVSQFFVLCLNAVNITMIPMAGAGRHLITFGDKGPEMIGRWEKVSDLFPMSKDTAKAMLISRPRQILYVDVLVYSFALPLPRLVILLLYIRVFPTPKFKIAVYAVGTFVVAWCPAVLFADMFQCSPVAFIWDKSIKGGKCINKQAFYRYIAVPIVLSDVAVLVLPLPMIWQLRMTIKQKLALSGVLCWVRWACSLASSEWLFSSGMTLLPTRHGLLLPFWHGRWLKLRLFLSQLVFHR